MAINLASKASPKVAERFTKKSATEGLFSKDYDWQGVSTVRVYSVDSLPLNDYDKTQNAGTTSRFGTMTEVGDTYQEMTVADDKAFNGSIDKGNNTAQLQIKAASRVLKRETDEVLIPYVDKYRLTKMAQNAGIGYFIGGTTLSSSNILEHIMKANAMMSNNNVPDEGRVLYMGYTTAILLKLASQVVGVDKLGEQAIVNGVVGRVDKCQVRLVPDGYMPSGINFMIVKTGVAVAPQKIETYRILQDHPNLDGHVVQGRLLHDCFVLNAKDVGICVCMANPYSVEAGANKTVNQGDTYQLEPTFKVVSGGKDIKIANFTYSSATTTVATVDANGLVTGVGTSGTSVITVTAGTSTDTLTITGHA